MNKWERYLYIRGQIIPIPGLLYLIQVKHFSEVIEKTDVEAALAAVIFHREEVPIETVKEHMREKGIEMR
jgi:imidazole glycerol phosphate synthase subunit HisF